MLVAVYGTLRKCCNANALITNFGGRFIGRGKVRGWNMYAFKIVGSYPFVVEGDGEVMVEVYEVSKFVMRMLDNYEGGLYDRQVVEVELDTGAIIRAWMYVLARRYYEVVPYWVKEDIVEEVRCGDWCKHIVGKCSCRLEADKKTKSLNM